MLGAIKPLNDIKNLVGTRRFCVFRLMQSRDAISGLQVLRKVISSVDRLMDFSGCGG